MVSADLSGMGKASVHPVRWSMMVRMCLLPEVEVLQSVTKSIAILSNSLSGMSVICNGYCWTWALSHLQRTQLAMYFWISVLAFPVILALDEAICVGISLMTQFIMGFYRNGVLPWLWNNQCEEFLASIYDVCIGVPLHEWRYQTHDGVLCHLAVFWKCICKKRQSFASEVMCPDDQLLLVLV